MGGILSQARRTGGRLYHFRRFLFLMVPVLWGILQFVFLPAAVAQEVFVDPTISLPTELVFTVDIAIDCAGQDVKGVEVVLAFDPFLLQLDFIEAGPWYTGTGQDYFFFDYTAVDPQGLIHFSSSVLDGTNDESLTIAVCHFTALGFGYTPVIFQDVDVRGPDNMDLGFGHSSGDQILIDAAIPVSQTSFGHLKALFR